MATEKELLTVLDMSHNEQAVWCEKPEHGNRQMRQSLADLAFRLRDEACKISCEKYNDALGKVYNCRIIIGNRQGCGFYAYQAYQIKPIDMIIAALMVIDKDKEDD